MMLLLRPLVAVLLAFLSGLVPALRFGLPPLPFVLLAVGLLVGAVVFSRRGAPARGVEALLLVAFVACGAALGSESHRAAASDCRLHIPDGTPLTVRGVLLAGAQPTDPGTWDTPLLPFEAEPFGGCGGELRVHLPAQREFLPAGSELVLHGEWVQMSEPVVASAWPRNPRYSGLVAVDSIGAATPPRFWDHPLLALRGGTEARLQRLFPRHAALAEALLLGRREWVDPELRDRFARAGLAHLLAISGMHVGLLSGALLVLGGALRIPRRALVWGTIAATAAYLVVIGAPPSAVRAGVMIGLAITGLLLQRPFAALPVIGAAALLILAHRPMAVLEAGFQLSFAGVIGILLARHVLFPWLPRSWRHRKPLRILSETAIVSGAAFAATAPIAAWHFGLVAPVAILANFPAVPLMSLALIGVGAAAVTEPLVPALGRLLADSAGAALDLLDRVAVYAAALPYGHLEVPRPDAWLWAVGAVAFLLALDAAGRLQPRVRWMVAGACGAAMLLLWPSLARPSSGALELHFLDVGQGDAIAVRTPADRWLLIDAGPRGQRSDAGERRVLPFLRAHGVQKLDVLVLTHPDADHIGGAPAVLRGLPVKQIVEPGLAVGKGMYLELLQLVEAKEIPWSAARSGRVLQIDGVRLEFLWPDPETLDASEEANQISAVIRLEYGDFSALLTGDAPAEVEQRLVERYGTGLRSQILKAGHHGSATSTSEALLDAVRPELVVVSAGRRNRYGHPAPEVVRRVQGRAIPIARTDRDGTVSIRALPAAGRWNHRKP